MGLQRLRQVVPLPLQTCSRGGRSAITPPPTATGSVYSLCNFSFENQPGNFQKKSYWSLKLFEGLETHYTVVIIIPIMTHPFKCSDLRTFCFRGFSPPHHKEKGKELEIALVQLQAGSHAEENRLKASQWERQGAVWEQTLPAALHCPTHSHPHPHPYPRPHTRLHTRPLPLLKAASAARRLLWAEILVAKLHASYSSSSSLHVYEKISPKECKKRRKEKKSETIICFCFS